MPTETTTPVAFANGVTLGVPESILTRVRGLDSDGDLVISTELTHPDGNEFLVPLTACCFGSGKGTTNSPTGVCCRACHRPVDAKHGGPATVVTAVAVPTSSMRYAARSSSYVFAGVLAHPDPNRVRRSLFECDDCGAVVADMTRHNRWHEASGSAS